MRIGTWVVDCVLADAPTGPRGPVVSEKPRTNAAGQGGRSSILTGQGAAERTEIDASLACAPSLLYLEVALRVAESAYANSNLDEALDQLCWIGRLVLAPTVRRALRESIFDSGLADEAAEASEEFDAIRTKTFVLLRRLSLGLDYWGNQENFVPLVSHAFYSQAVDRLLEHARAVEAAYIRYRDAHADWTEARRHLEAGIGSQENLLVTLDERIRSLADVESALVRDIERLTAAYDDTWHRVLETGKEFKDAVRRETNGCEFKDVLVAVGAIATAVSTAGTGAAAAIAAWQAYNQFDKKKYDPDDKLGDLAEPKYKIEKVVAVGKGVSEVAKGVKAVADALDRPNPVLPNLPADAGKLIMQRKDLEATIEPFRHLPEAEAYLTQVDEFIDLVTTRNNNIVNYNGLCNGRAEIMADVTKATYEIDRLREKISRPNVRQLPEFMSFMSRANTLNKRVLTQILYQEHRALEYWAGERYAFEVSRDSIDHLATTHTQIYMRLVAAMENRGRDVQTFAFSDEVAKFSLFEDLGPTYLERFREKGQTVFSIPYGPFQHMALVRVTSVRLALPGVALTQSRRGTDPFGVRLTHLGTALLRNMDGRVVEFSHEPRTTHLFCHPERQPTRSISLGGSEAFVKLTPEGPWAISIVDADRARVDLSSVTDIVIEFEGEFFPER